MTGSMSRRGHCRESVPTESCFNSFKQERMQSVSYATHADVKASSFKYISIFYNWKRRHSPIVYCSPLQFLEDRLRQLHREKRVA